MRKRPRVLVMQMGGRETGRLGEAYASIHTGWWEVLWAGRKSYEINSEDTLAFLPRAMGGWSPGAWELIRARDLIRG